jgi:predicted lipoprotein with Yx(FWY)xxD motif
MTMRRLALLLPFAAAALIAAGCGEDDSNGNGNVSGSDRAAMNKTEQAMKGEDSMKADGKGEGAMKSESKMASDEAMKAGESMSAKATRVKVVDSDYGRVIADGKGEAFYLFDKENTKKPECYGACARAWPPVLTKGKPQAGSGAKRGLLGTTKRSNGKLQVTYAGQPLYYYVEDSPGTILCHDVEEFGGLWLVVKPNGQAAS